jgi:hypothetical protein
MKSIRFLLVISTLAFIMASCGLFRPKYGCPSNGKNVGAEKILSGEKTPKAKKFKS